MINLFLKLTSSVLCVALLVLLVASAGAEELTKQHESQVVTVEEWLPNEMTSYVANYAYRDDLIDAVKLYCSNDTTAVKYVDLILENAWRTNLDPWLIASVIAKESSFRRKAKSSVGAYGLMQIMPQWNLDNGEVEWTRIKHRAGRNLFDPEVNIRYGTLILKHYFEKYKTSKKALAAYNGSKGSQRYPNAVYAIFQGQMPVYVTVAKNEAQ